MELFINFNPLSELVDTVGFDPTEKGSIPLEGVFPHWESSSIDVSLLPTSGMLIKNRHKVR